MQSAIDRVVSRPWFYVFDLPDGRRTSSYLPAEVAQIHATRLQMLMSALEPVVAGEWCRNSVIDIGCHQGFFASHLARKGCSVLGVDARPEHIADLELIASAYGLRNLRGVVRDVAALRPDDVGQFDVTLMMGILYHIENPVGAIRMARALTRKACVIETQVVPNVSGFVEWGARQFRRPLIGSLGIIDESAETHAPEASITGFCVAPSYEALLFLMQRLGFSRVERVAVPTGGYEQLATGKRVMVVGHVDHHAWVPVRHPDSPSPSTPIDPSGGGQGGAIQSHAATPLPDPDTASRLEFSGERYVPDSGWASIAYEHLARYTFAEPLAAGATVLDVGSGEGYGAHLLSGRAALVLGIDISPDTVRHAAARYSKDRPHLRFVQGSATSLPVASQTIDLVVAFELLEHIAEQEQMLSEVRRVLRPGGLLLISTPNRLAYSDMPQHSNPFHVKELYLHEFRDLVEGHFRAAAYFTQKNLIGSLISPADETRAAPMRVGRLHRREGSSAFEPTSPQSVDHMYFIAACSDSNDALAAVAGIVVADRDERMLQEPLEGAERRLAETHHSFGANLRERAIADHAMDSASQLAAQLLADQRNAGIADEEVPPEQNLYDLIVPSFNAPKVLKSCLDSLIANTSHRHLIHVIDDASTDPQVDTLMRGYLSRYPHVRYYRLPANLGFPGVVNAGFSSTVNDVVLVNADTEYPPGWLARMERCRHSSPAIHAVSPLSNNATICSVPAFNRKNTLPPGLSVADMDRLVRRTSLRRYPRAPTLVGFCMLITRRAIEEVGPFDMAFGRGYGEEVDWCQRAWALGYQMAICDDVYVYHHGEVGFSQVAERQVLRQNNERKIAARWPAYLPAVQEHCARNPLRFQQHKLFELLRCKSTPSLRVLHVTHNFDGLAGTELFTRQLVDGMHEDASSTVLYPAPLSPFVDGEVEEEGRGLLEGGLLKVRMSARLFLTNRAFRGVTLSLRSDHAERFFAEVLQASGAQVVQFSHLANLGSLALPLVARALGVPVVLVLHDYFLLCPDWNLLHWTGVACGEPRAAPDNPRCIECVGRRIQSRPGLEALHVQDLLQERWALSRAVLQQADVLVAPSKFVRDQFAHALGDEVGKRIHVIPHGTPAYPFQADYRPHVDLRVAFLGNANAIKGVDTFAEAARRMRSSTVRFRIIGGLAPGSSITSRDNLELSGPYLQRELSRLLQDVDVVFIGSIAHETYCYTLDESFRAGAPVIATAVGAIPERVENGETGLLIPPNDPSALVAAIERLDRDRELLARLRRNVARHAPRSIKETVSEYAALYTDLTRARQVPRFISEMAGAQPRDAIDSPLGLKDVVSERGIELALPLAPEQRTVAQRKKPAKP